MFNTVPENEVLHTAAILVINLYLLIDDDTFQEKQKSFAVTLYIWVCVFAWRTHPFGENQNHSGFDLQNENSG